MKPRAPAWKPADYTPDDVTALQAVLAGIANDGQQKRALDFIINNLCGTYEISFRSDADGGERETSFAEGRRFVGLQIVKLLRLNGAAIEQMRKKHGG